METGETCLYNKSIKNKHKEVYGMKKKMMMALMASMVLSTVLGAAGTAKADEDLYGFEEPVTIKIGYSWGKDFSWKAGQDSSNNDWVNLYKSHNIIPDVIYEVDSSQAQTKLSTAIMSGDYPDIISMDATDYVNYAQTGVIADITELYEKYASDELKEYVGVDNGQSMNAITLDGKIYGLPMMGNGYDEVPVMFIRQDWLDNLGLKMPTTIEELKEVARAFTEDDPDGNGQNDTYGLAVDGVEVLTKSIGTLEGFFECFGLYPGSDAMTFMDDGNGKVVWGGENAEKAKEAMTTLQEMYQNGSITRDFITMDSNSIFEEAGAGRCGIWFAPMWGGMVPMSSVMKSTPEAHITAAPIPDGTGTGDNKSYFAPSFTQVYCVSSKCENPEVLIKLMNLSVKKLCHPENEEDFNTYYGDNEHTGYKSGLMWTLAPLKNYDNFQKESAALQTGDTSELNMEQMSDYTNMKAFVDAKEAGTLDAEDAAQSSGAALYTVFGDPNGGYAALDQLIKEDGFVSPAYQGIPTEKMAEVSPTLKKLTIETIVKIITGESVDSYDGLVSNWHALGGDDALAEAQEWADSNK